MTSSVFMYMLLYVLQWLNILLSNLKEPNKKLIEILLIVKKKYHWNTHIIHISWENVCTGNRLVIPLCTPSYWIMILKDRVGFIIRNKAASFQSCPHTFAMKEDTCIHLKTLLIHKQCNRRVICRNLMIKIVCLQNETQLTRV